ncbi:hypothetical protein LZ30DRAFT_480660 [Colletotrichum cereale]|nr:hypothetical protein LZ30DRAFT_480660 [Colletotrichum cereale]
MVFYVRTVRRAYVRARVRVRMFINRVSLSGCFKTKHHLFSSMCARPPARPSFVFPDVRRLLTALGARRPRPDYLDLVCLMTGVCLFCRWPCLCEVERERVCRAHESKTPADEKKHPPPPSQKALPQPVQTEDDPSIRLPAVQCVVPTDVQTHSLCSL